MATAPSQPPSRLLAYLQLMRLPNVFTAMADVAMGFLFTHASVHPAGAFLLLGFASSCLYTGGMVLNDVFDLEQDRRERPKRPLPSGQIPVKTATRIGWSLLQWGIAAGWGASFLAASNSPGFVAIGLAALVVFYDAYAKRYLAGAVVMGACRAANVLLGMSAAPQPLSSAAVFVAGGIGIYIAGLTLFARREVEGSRRLNLAPGAVVAAIGLAVLIAAPLAMHDAWPFSTEFVFHQKNWLLLWSVIAVLIGWRFIMAIIAPEPASIQAAVKSGILGIVAIDAAVVYGIHGVGLAVGILILMLPAVLLGRWVYST